MEIEALRRAAGRGAGAGSGGAEGDNDGEGSGGSDEDEANGAGLQDDDDDYDMDDGEKWAGIGGDDHSDSGNDGLADKVESLEDAMMQMARGLQAVTTTVKRGFKDLANKVNGDQPMAKQHAGAATNARSGGYDGVFDLDTESFAVIGGKSEWEDLMARYDSAGEKGMGTIARGDMMPEKIYLCIPRDSDLFPEVTEDAEEKVRWDELGPYYDKKGSKAYDRHHTFKNLAKALPTPMHFQHAWGWFMVLVNFHYKDAALMSAMMQFATEVVQFDGVYKWDDCLRVYVNLARPILRGNLDQRIALFKTAPFALQLSKCPKVERVRVPLITTSTAPPVTRPPPVFFNGKEVCRKWNKGLCPFQCPHDRSHVCLKCGFATHKDFQCGTTFAHGPAGTGTAQRGFQASGGSGPSRPQGPNNGMNNNRQAGREN